MTDRPPTLPLPRTGGRAREGVADLKEFGWVFIRSGTA
jgi:hypothetical protein